MDAYEVLKDDDGGRIDDKSDEHEDNTHRQQAVVRERSSEKKGGGRGGFSWQSDFKPLVNAESPEEGGGDDSLPVPEHGDKNSINGNQLETSEAMNRSSKSSERSGADRISQGQFSSEVRVTVTQDTDGRSGSNDIDNPNFEFVPGNTSEFGLGSSDADKLIGTPITDNKILASSNEKLGVKDDSDLDTSIASERDNQAFFTESEAAFDSSDGVLKEKNGKSPLLPDYNILKDLVKKGQQGVAGVTGGGSGSNSNSATTKRNDKVPLLPSPAKTDVSSEEESTLMSVSLDLELDSLRSPGQPSSDAEGEDQGVCSKYSQLSEDGSSPSYNDDRTQTGEIIPGDKKNRKPSIFENALELSMVFTEFVDVESFSSSLGFRTPQTEDRFGGKFEDHLLILLRSASHKNLKSLLRRSGWPAESDARCRLWENLCVHLAKAGNCQFEDMASDVGKTKTGNEGEVSLPPYVDPKLIPTYHLNTYGVHTAHRILKVISHLNPDVLYCPLLYPLTSAFLHYMDPSACYNSMQALLRSCSPSYLTETKTSTRAASLVIRDLAKKYVKSAYVYVTKGVDETVFDHWMYWLFQDLPFDTVVCIIDSFLLEGHKVLYRVVLAILNQFTKQMKKSRNASTVPPDNMKKAISNYCSSLSVDSKRLLKIGFGIRGLTRKEISKLETRHQTQIKSQTDTTGNEEVNHGVVMCDVCPELIIDNGLKPLLTTDMLNTIWSWIPRRLTLKNATLLYTSDEHGITLRTLFLKSEFAEQTLLVIKTDRDEVFGAFLSASWNERREKNKPHTSFFGTGETFVFTMKPTVRQYRWVGADGSPTDWSSDLYMAGDDTILIVGSGNGEAIQLDAMMNRCRSTRCDTFNNDPLCSQEDFCCSVVQVYGFVD